MQEIAPQVFIENSYVGVTLGAINWSHGLVLIDAPILADDIRSWRSALLNLGGGVDRFLVNMDAHYDRVMGTKAMECTVIGHKSLIENLQSRPVSLKAQEVDTGAEWEMYSGLGSFRWAIPEITFSERLVIHWDDAPLVMESHPGSSPGAIWVKLPSQHIVFIGDLVVSGQPPFLGNADLPAWMDALNLLLQPDFQEYILVSGRSGLVTFQQVHEQLKTIEKLHKKLNKLADRGAPPADTSRLIPSLMSGLEVMPQRQFQYQQRLEYGLRKYYARYYGIEETEGTEL
jgi:glyoxylase-like metal-dependent hydrolase (beta-lactamase superfamily II)